MKLSAFVICVSNNFNYSQQDMYTLYLKHFDVHDAIMCANGDCLAVCVDQDIIIAQLNVEDVMIVDTAPLSELATLVEKIYNVVEMYNECLL